MPWRRFDGPYEKNLDIITDAVSLIVKAALLAARFSGRVRRRSLKRLAAMNTDTKAQEILFLKDKVYQLRMQVSKRVPLVKGFDHLALLCTEFETWYNSWRPHMTLGGLRPDDVYYSRKTEKPNRNSKTVPCDIERHVFRETRITGYRLTHAV